MNNLTIDDIGKIIEIKRKVNEQEITHKGYLVEVLNDSLKVKLLDNGYNISVYLKEISSFSLDDTKVSLGKVNSKDFIENSSLPNIVYIGTGGTIGTHVDYVTGGVTMSRTPQEIISTTPELEKIINIKKIESPFRKASEDIYYKDWLVLSEVVFKYLNDPSIDGIIITHGTDTLSFTGSALSFLIENINKPVLLVGAQRSPDRASFDGSLNLICAARFVKEKIPGVFTVMHGSINDDFCSVIKAVKSRKMHTSRRDAFIPVNDVVYAKVFSDGKIDFLKKEIFSKDKIPLLNKEFEEKVALIKIHPNIDPSIIDWYIEKGYKGIIFEGTGLGHVPTAENNESILPLKYQFIPYIKKAIESNLIVVMSSQCLFGRVNDKVYSNLRYLSQAGVQYLDSHDILPEVLQIKLSVALKKFKTKEEIIRYLKTNISGEITSKEVPSFYDEVL